MSSEKKHITDNTSQITHFVRQHVTKTSWQIFDSDLLIFIYFSFCRSVIWLTKYIEYFQDQYLGQASPSFISSAPAPFPPSRRKSWLVLWLYWTLLTASRSQISALINCKHFQSCPFQSSSFTFTTSEYTIYYYIMSLQHWDYSILCHLRPLHLSLWKWGANIRPAIFLKGHGFLCPDRNVAGTSQHFWLLSWFLWSNRFLF